MLLILIIKSLVVMVLEEIECYICHEGHSTCEKRECNTYECNGYIACIDCYNSWREKSTVCIICRVSNSDDTGSSSSNSSSNSRSNSSSNYNSRILLFLSRYNRWGVVDSISNLNCIPKFIFFLLSIAVFSWCIGTVFHIIYCKTIMKCYENAKNVFSDDLTMITKIVLGFVFIFSICICCIMKREGEQNENNIRNDNRV